MNILSYGPVTEWVNLPVSYESTLEEVFMAAQTHYASMVGENFIVEVKHLCSTPDDAELGTEAHRAMIYAARKRPWARKPARARWVASISFSLKHPKANR